MNEMTNSISLNCLVIPNGSLDSLLQYSVTVLNISTDEQVDMLSPMIKEQ